MRLILAAFALFAIASNAAPPKPGSYAGALTATTEIPSSRLKSPKRIEKVSASIAEDGSIDILNMETSRGFDKYPSVHFHKVKITGNTATLTYRGAVTTGGTVTTTASSIMIIFSFDDTFVDDPNGGPAIPAKATYTFNLKKSK